MSCTISKGRGYQCGGQVGGIKKIYVASFYDAEALIGVTTTEGTGVVTAVLNKADVTTLSFFEFDLDRQLSSFNQTILTGKGGAVAYQTDLELHMSHDSAESWERMQALVEGLWQIFVEDNNGNFYLLGLHNGVEITGGAFAHGGDVAYTDYVGYVVSMTGAEKVPAFNFGSTSPASAFATEIVFSASQY
jgi:hypothetical protein